MKSKSKKMSSVALAWFLVQWSGLPQYTSRNRVFSQTAATRAGGLHYSTSATTIKPCLGWGVAYPMYPRVVSEGSMFAKG